MTDQLDTSTVVEELRRFLTPISTLHQQLGKDAIAVIVQKDISAGATGSLAGHLTSLGYIVRLRKTVGGGEGSNCLHNLRHEFLSIIVPGESSTFIVDPHFKDQFEIAKPTDRYVS